MKGAVLCLMALAVVVSFLVPIPALCETTMDSSIRRLREFGFEIDDRIREKVWFSNPNSEAETLYGILLALGKGEFCLDGDHWIWTPSS